MMRNQKIVKTVLQAIAASAFLSVAVMLPQAGFSQESPGAVGDPRVDEPNSNTQINDPARPINEQVNPTSGPNAGSDSNTNTTPNSQMNNSGYGSGSGAGGTSMDMGRFDDNDTSFDNRIERYTNDPNATNTERNTEYIP